MKISFALLSLASADVCGDCDASIAELNDWHKNPLVHCEKYTDPRFAFDQRGACKECKVQCKPVESACAGIDSIEAGFWNKTGKKVKAQYITRAAEMAAERALERKNNQFEKEVAKYEHQKKKMAEKKAKEENKAAKKADWEAWRQAKREKNEAARAQRKQEKKDRKAAAKAAKELRKQQREQKRALADANKVLFSFYSDLEEHYAPLCPDLFLIKDNRNLERKYAAYKAKMSATSE